MNTTRQNTQVSVMRRINWPLAVGLAVFALVRPLFSIVGLSDALGKPLTPVLLTVVISAVWILVVGLSRVREPLLTLVFVGLGYAAAATVLSAILSPILSGQLQGPLTNPFALVAVFATNAAWGAICGLVAMGLQRIRG